MGGEGSGRKSQGQQANNTQRNMAEAGLAGSQLIRDYLRGRDEKGKKVRPLTAVKLAAAVKSVEHSIGLPKAKIELKTDALTMKDIAELAHSFGKDGPMSGISHPENSEDEDTMLVPTKPLTARQIKERAQN